MHPKWPPGFVSSDTHCWMNELRARVSEKSPNDDAQPCSQIPMTRSAAFEVLSVHSMEALNGCHLNLKNAIQS